MFGVVLKSSEIAAYDPIWWQRDDESDYEYAYRVARAESQDHWDAMMTALMCVTGVGQE